MNKELMNRALEVLKTNDEIFIEVVDELDCWNGYADGFRCYEMWELDDFHSGMRLSEFLNSITDDFNLHDEWFYYSYRGLESTDDKVQLYRDNVWESELLDNVIDNYVHLGLQWIDAEFDDLIHQIVVESEE